ncbi:hypothetical protein CLV58_12594 [Spirosoma oryzae]|uniref:Uncharacterized protein n=1 Tax=Spirosoma oryzae TaxID=1469603 RepID=A0A2T0S8V3_9BACT|nr:hypothetical protein CLV58_12594 [Spirosoma oryzae]
MCIQQRGPPQTVHLNALLHLNIVMVRRCGGLVGCSSVIYYDQTTGARRTGEELPAKD